MYATLPSTAKSKMLYLLQLFLFILQVHSMPSGAPAQACSHVYPSGHGGASQDIRDNPFYLHTANFDELGGTLYYLPETTYGIVLSGNGAWFRGYLVQARTVADESPVGSFTPSVADQRLSSCPIPESAVTHGMATDKTAAIMTWTAPPNGTGSIKFVFAVVQRYSPSENINTFWATAETATLHPCEFPVYLHGEQCVQTCPVYAFGNSETQQCEIYPESFTVSTNATEYYTSFTSDVTVGTAVINFSVVLNHLYWDSPVDTVHVELMGDSTTRNVFGLTSDGADVQTFDIVPILETNKAVEFSIYYNMIPPETVAYPFDFTLTMDIIVTGRSSGSFRFLNTDGLAKGRIYSPGDLCSSTPCLNGATCTTTSNHTFMCNCPVGYTGNMCEANVDDTDSNQLCTCMNGGSCTDDDFSGIIGSIDGSGTICRCPSGFTGALCETNITNSEIDPICQENSCNNGGTCNEEYGNNFSCICASGYGGSTCNITLCDDMCFNGGTCAAGVCICAFGFTGDTCETKLPLCMETSCLNGGTCFEAGGQEVCSCLPKFTGARCGTKLCLADNDVPVYLGSRITYSWPQTEAGNSKRQVCPDICQDVIDYPPGAAVMRECLADTAEWQNTDVTGCGFSVTALQLCEAKLLPSNVDLATAVVNITADVSALESTAITVSGDIILDLTDAAIEEPEVRGNYLNAIDNVLEANMDDLLTSQRQSNSSTKILQGLNRFLDLVPVDNETGNVTFTLNNFGVIALELMSINESEIQQTFSANLGPVKNAVLSKETIPAEQLLVTSEPISDTTGLLTPQLESCSQTNGSQRIAYSVFRTAALFLTPETACEQFTIGSIILGVRINFDDKRCSATSVIVDMQRLTEVCREILAPNSTLSFSVDENSGMQLSSDQESICSNYADSETSLTSGGGRWSSDSCRKIQDGGGRTVCDCSQLGHFGLLFDLNPGDSLSPLALAIVSYIGTILSVVCLIIVILTYLYSKDLRKSEHGGLLINLSISLTCLYVVFVIAGLVTSVKVLCGLVSALFQYFMLVYFGWTAAEAVLLYYKLVKVLGKPIENYVLKAAIIIWSVPLLIVTVSVGPGYKYYINPYYCRATEWPFWFGLILPFCIIYAFNWIMFTIIMVQLLHRSTTLFKHDEKSKTAAKKIKQNLIVATGLSILFGLGWGIGLTATSSDVKEVTFAFQVLFSVFVGSQGVLIFLFYGIRSPQFRKVWVSVFRLRSKQKVFSQSSKHPKQQSGLSTSSSYNLATLTATGTLPSDSSSKHEYNTQKIQLAFSLATDSEAGISTFKTLTVVTNPKSFSETN